MMRRRTLLAVLLTVAAACSDGVIADYTRILIDNSGMGKLGGAVTMPDIEGNPAPFPNVSILLLSSAGPGAMAAVIGRTHSDSSGAYLFSGLQPGTYGLAVNAPTSPSFDGADMYGIPVDAGHQTVVNIAAGRPDTLGGGGGPDTTGAPTGPVASVTVQPSTQTVMVGDSVPVMALIRNAQNQLLDGRVVAWTISDTSVVYVFASAYNWAVLRAGHSGSVTVTATSEGKSGTGTVTARQALGSNQ